MNNQNNTYSKDRVNFEYKTLKDASLEDVFNFYNWLREDEPLSESMFLIAWDAFNIAKSKKENYSRVL